MASYTSTASGNWTDTTKWTPTPPTGGPGSGDTATVNHAITVDANSTIGTSPDDTTTNVLTVSGLAGKVIVSPGVTLTIQGNSYFNAGTSKANFRWGLDLQAGASVLVGSAALPSRSWRLKLGDHTGMCSRGTAQARCMVTKVAGGTGPGVYGVTGSSPAAYDCEYTDFYYCSSFYANADSRYHDLNRLHKCRVTYCGSTYLKILYAGASNLSLSDCYFGQSTGAVTVKAQFNGIKNNTGLASVSGCYFDDRVTFYPPTGWTVSNNVFNQGLTTPVDTPQSKSDEVFASFTGNVSRQRANLVFESSADGNYFLDDVQTTNSKHITWGNKHSANTLQNNVFESVFSTNGDLVSPVGLPTSLSTTRRDTTIKNNVFLPNAQGNSPGKCVSHWVASAADSAINCFLDFENNTVISTRTTRVYPETALGLGEFVSSDDTLAGNHPGMISSFKNNLFWSPSTVNAPGSGSYPQGGFYVTRQQSLMQDMLYAADMDYNWGWNLSPGSEGNGVHCVDGYTAPPFFSTGTPNTHGGSGDPQFIDTDRCFANYDTKVKGRVAPAWASGAGYVVGDIVSVQVAGFYGGQTINFRCIAAHTSATGNATLGQPGAVSSWPTTWEFATHEVLQSNPAEGVDIIAWVRAGYVPQNQALKGSGYNGSDIGALAVYSAPASSSGRVRRVVPNAVTPQAVAPRAITPVQ